MVAPSNPTKALTVRHEQPPCIQLPVMGNAGCSKRACSFANSCGTVELLPEIFASTQAVKHAQIKRLACQPQGDAGGSPAPLQTSFIS
eukprot:258169-Amphidinium_carterae.1